VTIVWASALILLGREVNRRYRMLEFAIPDGATGLEFLILIVTINAAFGMLSLLSVLWGLNKHWATFKTIEMGQWHYVVAAQVFVK